jgi:hypothetical protein
MVYFFHPTTGGHVSEIDQESSSSGRFTLLRKYVVTNALPLFSAFVIGLGIPMWRYVFVDAPALHVEITGLDKVPPDKALDPTDIKELATVTDLFVAKDRTTNSMKFDEIQKKLDHARSDALSTQSKVADARAKFDVLSKKTPLTANDVREYVYATYSAVGIPLSGLPDKLPTTEYKETERQALLTDVAAQVTKGEAKARDALQKIEVAASGFAQYRTTLIEKESTITAECAVSNSGGGAFQSNLRHCFAWHSAETAILTYR